MAHLQMMTDAELSALLDVHDLLVKSCVDSTERHGRRDPAAAVA
jgi:hypothetical protein